MEAQVNESYDSSADFFFLSFFFLKKGSIYQFISYITFLSLIFEFKEFTTLISVLGNTE